MLDGVQQCTVHIQMVSDLLRHVSVSLSLLSPYSGDKMLHSCPIMDVNASLFPPQSLHPSSAVSLWAPSMPSQQEFPPPTQPG